MAEIKKKLSKYKYPLLVLLLGLLLLLMPTKSKQKQISTATDDELRLVLESELLHLVIIHTTCLLVQVVTYRTVKNT